MRLPILFIVFIFSATSFYSQNDTIGRFSPKGKKQGYWFVYLDSNARETDSSKAVFKAYEYYHNGESAFNLYNEKWKSQDSSVFVGQYPDSTKPVLLNGKITWYDKKDQRITYDENYENGMPMKFKHIRYKKKDGHYTWAYILTYDFSKRFRNEHGTYFVQEQNNQAIYSITEFANFWYRGGKRGYKRYRVGD